MKRTRFKSYAVSGIAVVVLLTSAPASSVQAGVASTVIQEAVEFTARKFSREVAEEGVERLAAKMSALAARHSEDVVVQAFKRVGPRAGKLVSEAGEHGDDLLRLLARHGDAAIPLATRKTSLGLVREFGEEAGEACIRHGTIAEPIIEQFGGAGAEALTNVSDRSARQLAMLAQEGTLKPEMIDVVIRYGDKACAFLWKNKGTVAGGAVMASFLANPEQYLDSAETIAAKALDVTVKPLASEAAARTNWTAVVLLGMSGLGVWHWARKKRAASADR